MANPLVHALVFIAAVVIPGGLLLYFAWRASRRRSISLKAEPNRTAQIDGFEHISEESPTPDEALSAFLTAFPKYPKDSLRARSRSRRLRVARMRPRKKSQ